MLQRFQQAGHKVIVVIGGATARIGDPSGKKGERELLPIETIKSNISSLSVQINKLFDSNITILDNAEWFEGMSCLTFLRDIGKHFPLGGMLSKDSVASRIATGISFTEFSYQLLQGHDFAHLNSTLACELQIGGSDQWGNIVAGLELIRRTNSKECFGLTFPLLTKSDGSKMGKSEDGAVWLNASKTSPFKFFQFWRQVTDLEVGELLLKLTSIPPAEISSIMEQHRQAPQLGKAQEVLAAALTAQVHGDAATENVKIANAILFNGSQDLTEHALEVLATEIPTFCCSNSTIEAVAQCFACSKSQARRDIQSKGISINGKVIGLEMSDLDSHWIFDKFILLRKGKRQFALGIRQDKLQ